MRETHVPFHDLRRQVADAAWPWEKAVGETMERGRFISPSAAVEDFETAFAAFCGVEHAVAAGSGSAALLLAMLALDVGPGDEVIVPANTFVATLEAVRLLGGRPVLADVLRETYTLDPDAVAALAGRRTKAIVAVHLYGRPAEVHALAAVAERCGAWLIEDACQAAGASVDGQRAGSFGHLAAFSFGRTKPLAGAGEGGAVVTRDETLAARLRLLNRHGLVDGDHVALGFNLRMHPLEAAVVGARLRHADYWLEARREVAARYNAAFAPLDIVRNPLVPAGTRHSYYVYAVEATDRPRFLGDLDAAGIGWAIHYPRPLHAQAAHTSTAAGPLAVTDELAGRVVSLPIFAGMTEAEMERVVAAVHDHFTEPTRLRRERARANQGAAR